MTALTSIMICGIRVHSVSMEEALHHVECLIEQNSNAYVVTPNVDVIVKLQEDAEFNRIYKDASLVLPDGMPLLWAGRFLGTPFKERVPGSDLFVELCAVAARKGYRVFLLGARPGVADAAARILTGRMPGLQICGTYSPSFGFEGNEEENARIVRMIRRAAPHVLFVGLGSPKQEKWIDRYRLQYGAPVSISVGISFDYVAGTVRRACRWMQKSGLEWFWRLLAEPRRLWKRYLVDDPRFFWLVLLQRLKQKKVGGKDGKA